MAQRRIAILGSTGSVGVSALSVAKHLKNQVRVTALAAGRSAKALYRQAVEFKPEHVAISDVQAGAWLKTKIGGIRGKKPRVWIGPDAMERVAALPACDMVLTSVVGAAGLVPTLAAIRAGKDIALANKETLVAAGELVSREATRHKVRLLPVDSEHNAIFQCLEALPRLSDIKRLILTASGGPFRQASMASLKKVTVAQALKHPTWAMGPKISVDSATMMNKGLEVIEARWLFGVDYDRIAVVVHPQSVIHSMVETVDASILAQLGPTDMRLPIQHAFLWPQRLAGPVKRLDFSRLKALTFEAPDTHRFPCLALALKAGNLGGCAPAALNAANEIAVAAFIAGKLSFLGIPQVIATTLRAWRRRDSASALDLKAILDTDAWARAHASHFIEAL